MDSPSNDRDSTPDFEQMRAGARKRNLLLGGGGGALVVLAVAGFVIFEAKKKAAERAELAGEFRTCLVGGPLESGETLWQRMRRLQIDSLGHSDAERATKSSELWPTSCRASFTKLKDHMKTDLAKDQLEQFEKFQKILADPASMTLDLEALAKPTFAALDAHVPGEVKSGGKLPKRLLDLDGLAKIKPLSKRGNALGRTYTEDNPGLGLPVLVADEDEGAPLLCDFDGEAAKAVCKPLAGLSELKKRGLRLLGTSEPGSATLVFAGQRGLAGVFSGEETTPFAKVYAYGGYAAKDGSASVLGWEQDEKKLVLLRRPAKGEVVRTVLEPNFTVGNYFYSSQLLWDQVLVRGVTPDNERRLFSLPLSTESSGSFSMVDVGEVPEAGLIRYGERDQTHITGCKTNEATVVRVRGYNRDFLTFKHGTEYTKLVEAPDWGTLGCYQSTATFVQVAYSPNGTGLHHAACKAAGCDVRELPKTILDRETVDMRVQDERYVQAVDIGGKLLAVWIAGENGGLRMRIGEPETFERAKDDVLFDDRTEGGKKKLESSILGFRLYSREKFAVLLLSTLGGLHAFKIDARGAVAPFDVQ